MHILFLNPYHGGSHAVVAAGYAAHSQHKITLLTLPTEGGWRWRMRGGAVALARMARATPLRPDLILTTDMLDLAAFRALTRDLYPPDIPAVLYFHENQLTYPLPKGRARDLGFAWMNYTSALVADAIFFNSDFHRRSFLETLPGLLGRYHDYQELETIETIAAKAQVLPPGIDLQRHDQALSVNAPARSTAAPAGPPVILWNSRWDYDKQPQVFFDALEVVAAHGADFQLIVAGEHVDPNAPEFITARERWSGRIVHWGYAADPLAYSRLLHQADLVVSTAIQEFFGIGIVEALYCGCIPILPRRLTYPELLPTEHHAACLYDSFEELVGRLHTTLRSCADLGRRDWRAIAAPYDWSRLGPQYDAALAGVKCSQM
jgi:glycosyltransferase involved in cell wall biosynthesis